MAPDDPQGQVDPLAPHSLSAVELKELLAAERRGALFAFRDREGRLVQHHPGAGRTTTLGRRQEADLTIDWDPEVSGLHAELEQVGGEWTVIDDGLSTNGTFVNEKRVTGRVRLADGDRVRLGRTVLVFRSGGPSQVAATAIAAEMAAPQKLTDTQRGVLIALCRPFRDGESFATPATNQQIAAEVFLGVDAVKMHLRTLFGKFELSDLPPNQKRTRLAEAALRQGIVTQRDLVAKPSLGEPPA